MRRELHLYSDIGTDLYGGDCRVDGRGLLVAADGEEEERYELETVVQHRVDPVLFVALVGANVVQLLDLGNQSVVEFEHILGADVGAAVALEYRELVAQLEQAVEDGLFLDVERGAYKRRVGHGVDLFGQGLWRARMTAALVGW